MFRKNKALEAVVLASLLALPVMASAQSWYGVGPVTVDGTKLEPSEPVIKLDPTEAYQTGKAGSVVEVGDFGLKGWGDGRYSVMTVQKPAKVVLEGRTISTKALWAEGGSQIVVGGADTETVTIAGDENTVGLSSMRFNGEEEGTSVTVTAKDIQVSTAGSDDTLSAIWGQNSTQSETAPEGAASVTLKGDTIHIQSPGTAIVAFSNSQININGDTTIDAGKYAVDTRGHATTNINTDGAHKTVIKGDILFETPATTGDSKNSGNIVDANVNLNLTGSDSSWTGKSYQKDGETEIPTSESGSDFYGDVTGFNLTLKDGAAWKVTGDSFVNGIRGQDGVVDLGDGAKTVIAGKVEGESLTVNTASLDNKLTMKQKDETAKVTVHGTGALADAIKKDSANAQKLANVAALQASPDASAADKISTDEGTVAGKYEADVKDGKVTNVQYEQNRTNAAVTNMALTNLITWRQENNDMNKRLGELRDSKGKEGVWARMVRGEAKYSPAGLKNQYNYYQVGYDTKLSADSRWTVGAAFNKTDGTTTFDGGTSDNDHHGLALYGSYLGNNGTFVDLIAKYSSLDMDYRVAGGAGSGDYDVDAYSVSAEVGKRIHGSHGFWVEPQAELTYGRVQSADYTTSNRVSVHQDSMDSFVGRLGFSLGKDIKAGNVYARASYLYDFDGETSVTMAKDGVSDAYKQDIGGGWWEVGVGTNLNLSKATHMYIDLEKTYGGDVTTPWQWGLGMRYSF